MRNAAAIMLVLALGATGAIADTADEPAFGALTGQVSSAVAPLAFSKVYAYHLSGQDLSKVATDRAGNFQFERLPAGLYKIIAFKDGFVPTIALLSRAASDTFQYLRLELYEEDVQQAETQSGFWAVREKIPSDVLRDIEIEQSAQDDYAGIGLRSTLIRRDEVEAQMSAVAGMDQNSQLGEASMAGGHVDVEGSVSALQFDLTGDYVTLQPVPGSSSTQDPTSTGRSQNVALRLETKNSTGVRVSSTNNYMSTRRPEGLDDDFHVGLERHQVSWTQNLGRMGRSDLSAEFSEENNFFNQSPFAPFGIPDASRTWRVAGSHTADISSRSNIQTGFSFRQRDFLLDPSQTSSHLGYVPMQRVDLYGQGGYLVSPGIMVEIGMYSTLRDGSLALAPSAGVAVQLGQGWRAEASGSVRAYDEPVDPYYQDFTPALFGEYSGCQTLEEYCYQVTLAHANSEQEEFSVGVINRQFAETLHLYFNDDFFSRLESLYLVRGDTLPEVSVAASRRLSPKILARLASNIATGGGGILYATDKTSYENEVRYLVTSLDTRFQQTDTGVFMAFHHVGQKLTPIGSTQTYVPEMELERLQLMLSQDLGVLSRLASDWAIHLNMEVSRGATPDDSENQAHYDNEELRKRVMGGVSVSF